MHHWCHEHLQKWDIPKNIISPERAQCLDKWLNTTHIDEKFWNRCHKHNSKTPHYRYFTSIKQIVGTYKKYSRLFKTKLWEHYFLVIPLTMIINNKLREKNCIILSTVVFVTPAHPSQILLNAFMVNNTLLGVSKYSPWKKNDTCSTYPTPTSIATKGGCIP